MAIEVDRGKLIVFEGGEGTGKSTQARLLAEALAGEGIKVVLTREPGGAPGAEMLRRLLVDDPPAKGWLPASEALLHYAARHEHIERSIRPALMRGCWVVCDRFADSTHAYQGAGLALDAQWIESLRELVIGDFAPDLSMLLDMDSGDALTRAAARSPQGDRYERMDAAFHARVREAFLQRAARAIRPYVVIDAAPDPQRVHDCIRKAVRTHLNIGFAG
ncbi:MAG: dTMP kinase [Rhodospirillales bacterium]|nr:dTMP kinase [Rhodospirillales bacterium]